MGRAGCDRRHFSPPPTHSIRPFRRPPPPPLAWIPFTDKFYYLAKEQGYRSRAAFKLVQLNRKYDFFSGARACMDLCAAPGGWLQVAAKYMPMSSTIVGVDLAPIKPIRGCTTFVDDITTQSCRAQLKRVTPDGVKYDVVIHDGAPNVGGNFAAESYTQAALTLDSLRLATEFLREGGWFVTKVFRSTEYHALLYSMQQLFKKVESTKPVASRGTSAEIYVVCAGYLAPRTIDPRLLDARHLFAEYEGPKQAVDVLSNQKQKRNRSGYEDGVTTLYKECPAENFVLSEKPAEMLGQFHAFLLDAKVRRRRMTKRNDDGFFFFFLAKNASDDPRRTTVRLFRPTTRGRCGIASRRAGKPMTTNHIFTVCPTFSEETFCSRRLSKATTVFCVPNAIERSNHRTPVFSSPTDEERRRPP